MTNRPTSQPVALVLGGVSPHIAVIERLKSLGYWTALADYKDAPPAADYADEHLQISTLDAEAVEQAARDLNAQAVISVCLDQPLPILAQVRQALGIASPLTPVAAHRLTNKDAMKQVLREGGVDTAKWIIADRPEAVKDAVNTDGLRFPVVAKPVGGTGSLGVVFAADEAALTEQLDQSFAMARGGDVLVEEFVEGMELSIDCIVIEGKTHVLLARERHKTWFSEGREATCHATLAPARQTPEIETLMQEQAEACARAFELSDGPMLIQSILTQDGRLVVLEVAGRIGGGPGANRVVELVTGFDYVGASIDQQLGRAVAFETNPDSRVFSANNAYASEGVFDRVTGMDALLADGLVEEHYIYRMQGEDISDHLSGRSRVTAFVVAAETHDALRDRLVQIYDRLDILDTSGRSILRRDIGLHHDL
ncbi:ATP-grasp domain-containing protein [uncultured Pelagimonas sp.]|uniref:ATP-grasp domain-containing protein n=1 Tax=uncultured Pelagimonas sp. TaxID=1618102 RepID=UPI00261C6B09|nr:ATP-grasp domain-containing protein [uncultured Pelagimonas sp.]